MQLLARVVESEKAKKALKKVEESAEQADMEQVTETAAEAGDITQSFLQIDWANPNWDLFVLGFFLVAALLYGISLGKDRIIMILVSMYMALAVVEFMPPVEFAVDASYQVQIASFIGLFVMLFFVLSRSALMKTFGGNSSPGSWMQVMIFSFLHVGLLISVTLSYLPPEVAEVFSPMIRDAFTGEWQKFAWICAPIVAMIMLKDPDHK